MANRLRDTGGFDLEDVLNLNSDPDLPAERQAEARKLLQATLGPYAEAVLRTCDRLAAGRRELKTLHGRLSENAKRPQLRGVVTGNHNGRVRLLIGGSERLLPRPAGLQLGIGQTVLTDAEGTAVLVAGDFLVGGVAYVFSERLEHRHVLVQPVHDGRGEAARQLAVVADCVELDHLEPGDLVLGWSLEYGNVVLVTRRLGKLRPNESDDLGSAAAVERGEIVGLDHIINDAELLFLSSSTPEYEVLLSRANSSLAGLVFQGPSGCGKSTVAQYLVGQVRARGGVALYRTASHYLSKWVGEGAALLRADFARLDADFSASGVRPLLVVDELEAIAIDRSLPTGLSNGHLDVLDTLLSLLTRTQCRMIGISNVANRFLETALVRDGRLRVVGFPSTLEASQVEQLAAQCLTGIRLAADDLGIAIDAAPRGFAQALSDLVFAPSGALSEVLRVQLSDGRLFTFGARDFATAAAIADGIVRPTLARIAQRDMRAGLSQPRPLRLEELRAAAARYIADRCAAITRDNVRSVLPDRLPEDQAVVKVERVALPDAVLAGR